MAIEHFGHLIDQKKIAVIVIRLGNAGYSRKDIIDALLEEYLVDLDLLAEAMNAYPFPVVKETPVIEPEIEDFSWTLSAGKLLEPLVKNSAQKSSQNTRLLQH